jgi:LmbE family N-acetylglucosaminyl deacetylase
MSQEDKMIESIIPTPDLMTARKILAIQPHYDDNDIGAGGTLARLKEMGAEIHYLTVTDDMVGVLDPELNIYDAQRILKEEQAQAGKVIGVSSQIHLGFPDAGKYDEFELRAHLLKYLRLLKPDFVFTPDPWLAYESHRDHVICGLAAASAVNLVTLPRLGSSDADVDRNYVPHEILGIAFYYCSEPNTPVDITSTQARKTAALRNYRAQFTEEDLEMLLQALAMKEQLYAQSQGMTLAEGFKVMAPIQLHCGL